MPPFRWQPRPLPRIGCLTPDRRHGSLYGVETSPAVLVQLPFLRLHQAVYRRSNGLVGKHVGGRPALLLTTKGRRTGASRTVALISPGTGTTL